MTHFEVGKCYRLGEEGKTLYRIESRTEKSALIAKLYDDGSIAETMRKKIYTEECGNIKEERIYPLGKSGTSAYSVISSRYEAESTTTSQPKALQPEAVMEDLAARIIKANNFKTICYIILRSQKQAVVKKFAQAEEISIPAKYDFREATAFIAKIIVDRLEKLANGEDIPSTNMWGLPCSLNSPVTRAFYESRILDHQAKLIPLPHGTKKPAEWDNVMRKNVRMCCDCENSDELRALLNTASTWDLLARTADACGVRFEPNATRNEIINATVEAHAKYKSAQKAKSAILAVSQPENLYDDGSFSDAQGDNSCPDQDIPDEHSPDVSTADNPGFTVEPSREIECPNYTPYPDTIADERPYVYVQPCYTPTHHTAVNPITAATMRFASVLAALLFVVYKVIIPVWYMRKKDLKKASANTFVFIVGNKYHVILNEKNQLITITDRRTDKYGFTWLSISDEDHNSYNVKVNTRYDGYTEFFDLKGLDRTCYAFQGLTPRKEIYRSKRVLFEVGKSYTAVTDRFGHQERHLTVLDRFAAVRYDLKDKIIKLKVRISGYNIKSDYVEGWIDIFHLRNDDKIENYYMTSYLAFRADNPDTVQETPAEISDITPEPQTESAQQPQAQPDAPKLQKLYLASDYKEYNKIRRENKALIDTCESEEQIVALMLTLSTTGILNQADYCRVSLFNADRKTDEQLAREFAAAIMKRRAKKLKASQQKTQSQPRKENPAPASDSEHTLIDTKDLHFSDRRKALEHNAAVITPCLFPEAAVALLMSISAKAIIQLGLYLGLFIAKQKGSKNAVIQEFVKRLFNLRETRSNQQNSNYATTPSQFTLHIPEGVKIIQLKNRQLGFIFIN